MIILLVYTSKRVPDLFKDDNNIEISLRKTIPKRTSIDVSRGKVINKNRQWNKLR